MDTFNDKKLLKHSYMYVRLIIKDVISMPGQQFGPNQQSGQKQKSTPRKTSMPKIGLSLESKVKLLHAYLLRVSIT